MKNHSATETWKTYYTIPNNYNWVLVENMWHAFRAERGKFIGGRDRFADHVHKTMSEIDEYTVILLPNNSEYGIPENPPDSKTLYNFDKTISSLLELELCGDKTKKLKTSISTLQYIHVFLWITNPSEVEKWEKQNPKLFSNPEVPIKNMDASFEVLPIDDLLPKAIKLIRVFDYHGEGPYEEIAFYNQQGRKSPPLLELYGWEPMGVLYFLPSSTDLLSKCVYLTSSQWDAIVSEFSTTKTVKKI